MVRDEFKALVDKHDRDFNTSGTPYKKAKRTAPDVPTSEVESVQAVPAPVKADIANKTSLAEKMELAHTVAINATYEVLVTKNSEVWIHALTDGIIGVADPLFAITGKYLTGQPAKNLMSQGRGAPTWPKQ